MGGEICPRDCDVFGRASPLDDRLSGVCLLCKGTHLLNCSTEWRLQLVDTRVTMVDILLGATGRYHFRWPMLPGAEFKRQSKECGQCN